MLERQKLSWKGGESKMVVLVFPVVVIEMAIDGVFDVLVMGKRVE